MSNVTELTDTDVELLHDRPTLLAQRLDFLDTEATDRVLVVLSQVCNQCWSQEQPCGCWITRIETLTGYYTDGLESNDCGKLAVQATMLAFVRWLKERETGNETRHI